MDTAQQFRYDQTRLFGRQIRFGETMDDIDIQISRWLETHTPIEIFDKQMPYIFIDWDYKKQQTKPEFGTMLLLLHKLFKKTYTFPWVNAMQKYIDLLATGQVASVEPIKYLVNCVKMLDSSPFTLEENSKNLRLVDTAAEIDLSDCMQPDASPEMVAYITWLQTEFIQDILKSHRGQGGYNREEKHYFFVLYFEKLVIPVLEELTFLNRNPLGNAFIKNLSLRLPSGEMYSDKLYDFILSQFELTPRQRQEERKTLMDAQMEAQRPAEAQRQEMEAQRQAMDAQMKAQRKAMELTKAERKANDSQSAFIKADRLGYRGVTTNGDTSKMFKNRDGFGGKRTKKRKQKRSTNKKRRIHKKRGRMSKRR
jgi:hypothetical protein